MSIRNKIPSFSRIILPILAVIAIIITAFIVLGSQPDRSVKAATKTPVKASTMLGGRAAVAGAGVIEPSSEVISIGSHVSGVVSEVYVTAGQQVSAGQPLFAIDSRQVRAQIAEAEANITRARASSTDARAVLATAQKQLALYRGIEDQRAISRQEVIARQGEVDAARARLSLADAEIRAAQATRASASTELARHIVRAPISGEVLRVQLRPGEFAQAGGPQGNNATPFMEIGATNPLHVRIDIDEDEISRLDMGAEAVIAPRGNSAAQVKVSFVRTEPLVIPKRSLTNAASERVDVRVLQIIYAIPPGETAFFVGQQIDAFVPAKQQDTRGTQPVQSQPKAVAQ
jgi:HlyD family secretion protein